MKRHSGGDGDECWIERYQSSRTAGNGIGGVPYSWLSARRPDCRLTWHDGNKAGEPCRVPGPCSRSPAERIDVCRSKERMRQYCFSVLPICCSIIRYSMGIRGFGGTSLHPQRRSALWRTCWPLRLTQMSAHGRYRQSPARSKPRLCAGLPNCYIIQSTAVGCSSAAEIWPIWFV